MIIQLENKFKCQNPKLDKIFLVVNTYVTLTRKFFKILAILSKIING